MSTDTERLDFLQSLLFGKVTCRNSTLGRGFRLHQNRSNKHKSFDTVREAIDYYRENVSKDRCTCTEPEKIETFYDFCNKCKKLL